VIDYHGAFEGVVEIHQCNTMTVGMLAIESMQPRAVKRAARRAMRIGRLHQRHTRAGLWIALAVMLRALNGLGHPLLSRFNPKPQAFLPPLALLTLSGLQSPQAALQVASLDPFQGLRLWQVDGEDPVYRVEAQGQTYWIDARTGAGADGWPGSRSTLQPLAEESRMSASLLSLASSLERSRRERETPTAAPPIHVPPVLPNAPLQRSCLPLVVALSLGLHGLALLGAWAWQPSVRLTSLQPEPLTLVTLPPMASRPVAKPVAKPVSAPQLRLAEPAVFRETPTAAPVSESASAPDHSPAPERDAANAGQTEKASFNASASVSVDLHAAYRLNPAPDYPPMALLRGWEGTVRLRVTLDIQGHPSRVDLAASSGYPMLDESALAAVRRWQFQPATRLGEAVVATVEVPIVFKLKR
jgi:protein TonB